MLVTEPVGWTENKQNPLRETEGRYEHEYLKRLLNARTGKLSAYTMVLMPHSVKAQQGIMKADVIRSNKFVLS